MGIFGLMRVRKLVGDDQGGLLDNGCMGLSQLWR